MNILIKSSPYNSYLTVAAEHTAALVALLPHLRMVESSGDGAELTYTVEAMPPQAQFVDSAELTPLNLREQALKAKLEKKNSAWLAAFTERDAQKVRADELEREVARLRSGIVS